MTPLEHVVRQVLVMEFSEFGEDQLLIFPRDTQALDEFTTQWNQLHETLFRLLLGQGVSEEESRRVVGGVDEAMVNVRNNHPRENRARLRELAWDYFINHLSPNVRVLFIPQSSSPESEVRYDPEKCRIFLEHIGLDPTQASQPPNHPIWQNAHARLVKRLIEEADLLLRLDKRVLDDLKCEMPQRLFSGDDLKCFHEALIRVAREAGVDFSVPRRRCWELAALANAMRLGGTNYASIDKSSSIPISDWKVFRLYRKFGFKSMEDCMEKIRPRRAFALVHLLCSPLLGPSPLDRFSYRGSPINFHDSAQAWVDRIKQQMQMPMLPVWQECEVDVQYIGLDLRARTDKSTLALEAINSGPSCSYTSYYPEVHTFIFGPDPAVSYGWFRRRFILSSPTCVLDLLYIRHVVHGYSGPPFQPNSSVPLEKSPQKIAEIEASLRDLDKWVRGNLDDTWLREKGVTKTAPTTLSLLADALGTPVIPALPFRMHL